jgi:hypothetical protein
MSSKATTEIFSTTFLPRMVKFFFLVLMYCLVTGCGLKKAADRMTEMSDHLTSVFKHEDIDIRWAWGTDVGDDYLTILFYNFDVNNSSNAELQTLAADVRQDLLDHYKGVRKLDYVEVKFTRDADKDKANDFVTFKFENNLD